MLAGGDFGPEAFARLFEPALPLARRADGAQDAPGWDLFIAAEIARAHGGRLDTEVDSAGTQLVFSMPCRADREVSASEAPGHAQA